MNTEEFDFEDILRTAQENDRNESESLTADGYYRDSDSDSVCPSCDRTVKVSSRLECSRGCLGCKICTLPDKESGLLYCKKHRGSLVFRVLKAIIGA